LSDKKWSFADHPFMKMKVHTVDTNFPEFMTTSLQIPMVLGLGCLVCTLGRPIFT